MAPELNTQPSLQLYQTLLHGCVVCREIVFRSMVLAVLLAFGTELHVLLDSQKNELMLFISVSCIGC